MNGPTMADAVAGRRRPRPRPPTDDEIRAAHVTLRTHVQSIVAPEMCIGQGCHEPHPCPAWLDAEETLRRAGLLP